MTMRRRGRSTPRLARAPGRWGAAVIGSLTICFTSRSLRRPALVAFDAADDRHHGGGVQRSSEGPGPGRVPKGLLHQVQVLREYRARGGRWMGAWASPTRVRYLFDRASLSVEALFCRSNDERQACLDHDGVEPDDRVHEAFRVRRYRRGPSWRARRCGWFWGDS